MKVLKQVLLIAVGLLHFTTNVYAATGQPYSDEWIEGRISGAMAYNTSLDSTDISVSSSGGVVTLKGKVPSVVEKDFAEGVAHAVEGVKSVDNKLEVDESLQSQGRSTFSQKIRDAAISAGIKAKLLTNKNTHGLKISVSTEGNVVTLKGDVRSEKEKLAAEQLAVNTSGVRDVKNEIVVSAPASEGIDITSGGPTTAVSDAWINSRVRSLLTFSFDFPGSDVSVSTTNGKVTLQGYARTEKQKLDIAEVINDVAGVKAVDNQLLVRSHTS